MSDEKQKVSSGKIHLLKETGEAPRATLKNKNTASFCAAITCGAQIPTRFYVDTIEMDRGQTKRETTWILAANRTVKFSADFAEEEIEVGEVIRRFNDRAWCEANPNHPIAFLHFYADNTRRCIDFVKARKPSKLIRRGRRFLILDADCPPQVAADFLKEFENGK